MPRHIRRLVTNYTTKSLARGGILMISQNPLFTRNKRQSLPYDNSLESKEYRLESASQGRNMVFLPNPKPE